jgi:K+-sensing histidine kinase KdpD
MSRVRSLADVSLTTEEIRMLLVLQASAGTFVVHGGKNLIGGAFADAELLTEFAKDPLAISPDIAEFAANILESATRMKRSLVKLEHLLDLLRLYHPDRDAEMFFAKPSKIVSDLIDLYPERSISVTSASPHLLEFWYPRLILKGLMGEVVENAIKHSPEADLRVEIDWRMEGDRFVCDIHDSGIGISTLPTRGFVPLASLNLDRHDTPSGLAIAESVMVSSRGLLLFARSPLLGGTQVHFEMPVIYFADSRAAE